MYKFSEIDSLFDLRVSVKLIVNNLLNGVYSLTIESKDLYNSDIGEYEELFRCWNKEEIITDYESMVANVFDIISKLKFNKLTGHFEKESVFEQRIPLSLSIINALKCVPHVKLSCENIC